MTLPRKKSRRLVIAGRPFRWLISGNRASDDGSEDLDGGRSAFRTATVTVQEDIPEPGRVMQATIQSKERGPEFYGESLKAALTPKDVTRLIGAALLRGWDPQEKGGAFKLQASVPLEDYKVL